MPDLAWNVAMWDGQYDWKTGGEQWSRWWGGSEFQWFGSLYPRLHRHLPTGQLLEIAPGFGRWSKFLIGNCKRYIGIDVSQKCIDACQRTFSQFPHASFAKNDGLTLAGISSGSCNFVFSFDSLVHADLDVLQSYVPEILRVLSPDGAAFIHHSNLAALDNPGNELHARSGTVSAKKVAEAIGDAGGYVLIQELINWGGECLLDSMTLFAKCRSTPTPVIMENPRFMEEAAMIRNVQSVWSTREALPDAGEPHRAPGSGAAAAGWSLATLGRVLSSFRK
jgi:SAM-dependent methyltransferase